MSTTLRDSPPTSRRLNALMDVLLDLSLKYGEVREHQRLYIGYERLRARQPRVFPPWPGTQHMRGGAHAWLL